MTIVSYTDEVYVTVLGKKFDGSQEAKPVNKLTLFAFGAALGLCKRKQQFLLLLLCV